MLWRAYIDGEASQKQIVSASVFFPLSFGHFVRVGEMVFDRYTAAESPPLRY